MPFAPRSVPDSAAEAIATTLSSYRHLSGCAPCLEYLLDIAGAAAVTEVHAAVLAFHHDCHQRDPRSVAVDFFATA